MASFFIVKNKSNLNRFPMLNILKSPSFQDPETNRIANFLHKFILGIFIILSVLIISTFITIPENKNRTLIQFSFLFLASFSSLYLMRRGRIKLSAIVFFFFMFIILYISSWTGGGIKSHGIVITLMLPIFVSIIFGERKIWFFGLFLSLCGLFLVIMDYYNILPREEPYGSTPFLYWVVFTTCIFLICFMETLAAKGLKKAMTETQNELKLREESEKKYRLIFESFQDVYYQTSLDGILTVLSPSIKTLTGFDPPEVIGKNASTLYTHPEKRDVFMELLKTTKKVTDYEIELNTKNGKPIIVAASSQMIFNEKGEPIGIEGTLHDITERKLAENQLKFQNEKLLEISFLQSHMVRRPVSSILGLIHLMNFDNPSDPTNLEVIPNLQKATKELDDIIHEIVKNTNEIKGKH